MNNFQKLVYAITLCVSYNVQAQDIIHETPLSSINRINQQLKIIKCKKNTRIENATDQNITLTALYCDPLERDITWQSGEIIESYPAQSFESVQISDPESLYYGTSLFSKMTPGRVKKIKQQDRSYEHCLWFSRTLTIRAHHAETLGCYPKKGTYLFAIHVEDEGFNAFGSLFQREEQSSDLDASEQTQQSRLAFHVKFSQSYKSIPIKPIQFESVMTVVQDQVDFVKQNVLMGADFNTYMTTLQCLYDMNSERFAVVNASDPFKIPSVMHTVMVANQDFITSQLDYLSTTINTLPNWTHVIWVINSASSLSSWQDILNDNLHQNLHMHADVRIIMRSLTEILSKDQMTKLSHYMSIDPQLAELYGRLLVLNACGGVCRDANVEVLQDLNEYNKAYTFYGTWNSRTAPLPSIDVCGSIPLNPLLLQVIDRVEKFDDYDRVKSSPISVANLVVGRQLALSLNPNDQDSIILSYLFCAEHTSDKSHRDCSNCYHSEIMSVYYTYAFDLTPKEYPFYGVVQSISYDNPSICSKSTPAFLDFRDNILSKLGIKPSDFYNKLERLYKQSRLGVHPISGTDELRIKKTIHTIWLTNGNAPKPIYGKNLLTKTMKICPVEDGWEYVIWYVSDRDYKSIPSEVTTDLPLGRIVIKHVNDLTQSMIAGDAFWNAFDKKQFGKASDILRYEIIYQLGGVYRDTDFEFLKSPESLHYCVDFYGGTEDISGAAVSNAMFAAKPHHPTLRETLQVIQTNFSVAVKPFYLTYYAKNSVISTLLETGPFMLSKSVYVKAGEDTDDIIFPPETFCFTPADVRYAKSLKKQLGVQVGQHIRAATWM